MLEQQDDSGDGELRGKGRNQSRVNVRGSDVFETSRNGAQNLDWIFAFGVDPVTAVEPCGNGDDEHDKGIP